METLRVGFIGCGRHATKMLYPCLHYAGMNLVSVCDLDENKARRNMQWFGAKACYTDHRQMLDNESLDAMLICTGPNTHASLTAECIDRGLPVFVEKPPAMNLANAELLLAKSRAANIPVMVGMMKRHALVYQRLKTIIEHPEFGPISAIQAKFTVGWKNGNGYALLLDMGVHMLDLVISLMGEVDQFQFQKWEHQDTNINYAITLRFTNGTIGNIFLSNQHSWLRTNERVEVTGNGQFVIADNLIHLEHYLPNDEIITWKPGFSIPNDENSTFFLGGYAGEIQAFAKTVRDGDPPHADIADVCTTLRLIKGIEPNEEYIKGSQVFHHWQSENIWLQ